MVPDKKDNVVKAKQLEALKRLGHNELKLDEYERVLACFYLHRSSYNIFLRNSRQSRQ